MTDEQPAAETAGSPQPETEAVDRRRAPSAAVRIRFRFSGRRTGHRLEQGRLPRRRRRLRSLLPALGDGARALRRAARLRRSEPRVQGPRDPAGWAPCRAVARSGATRRHDRTESGATQRLAPGAVVEGKIASITDFGAFVELGGVQGLIHISELARGRVGHPSDVLEVGDGRGQDPQGRTGGPPHLAVAQGSRARSLGEHRRAFPRGRRSYRNGREDRAIRRSHSARAGPHRPAAELRDVAAPRHLAGASVPARARGRSADHVDRSPPASNFAGPEGSTPRRLAHRLRGLQEVLLGRDERAASTLSRPPSASPNQAAER